ncbi:hypothetical protein, partial [Thermodesulfatator indicus]
IFIMFVNKRLLQNPVNKIEIAPAPGALPQRLLRHFVARNDSFWLSLRAYLLVSLRARMGEAVS